ncbi:hypothetical protein VTL71DRAFT_6907 [Oculimacula yallundae]|uniref:Uncharacterized protein n=1 Tax=Oculimacula yallundae TaxID=86028 RepID=A0ABR4BV90_9HELO
MNTSLHHSTTSHLADNTDWVIISINPQTGNIIQQDEYEYALERFLESLKELRRYAREEDDGEEGVQFGGRLAKGIISVDKSYEENEAKVDKTEHSPTSQEYGDRNRPGDGHPSIGLGITFKSSINNINNDPGTSSSSNSNSNPRESANSSPSPHTDIDFADLDGLSDPESHSRSWSTYTNSNASEKSSSDALGHEDEDVGKREVSDELEKLSSGTGFGDDEEGRKADLDEGEDGVVEDGGGGDRECGVDDGIGNAQDGTGDGVQLAAAAHAVILAWLWAMEHWGWIE